jgi:hypothetical protein
MSFKTIMVQLDVDAIAASRISSFGYDEEVDSTSRSTRCSSASIAIYLYRMARSCR